MLTSFDLYEFTVQTMTWTTKPITVEFVVEKDAFGVGGFWEVFKATVAKSSNAEFSDVTWVIMRVPFRHSFFGNLKKTKIEFRKPNFVFRFPIFDKFRK